MNSQLHFMLHGKAKIYISSFTEQTTSVIQYSVKGRDEFVELYTRRFKEHKKLKKKKTQVGVANRLAVYKHGRGFELGATENKSSKWPEWGSNLGPPNCESDALITRPHCLLDTYVEGLGSCN